MRISDWSSDVCSSDLELARASAELATRIYPEPHYYKTGPFCNLGFQLNYHGKPQEALVHFDAGIANAEAISAEDIGVSGCLGGRGYARAKLGQYDDAIADLTSSREMESRVGLAAGENARSEEHTSELQSLMRISYAVFCLQKKNK